MVIRTAYNFKDVSRLVFPWGTFRKPAGINLTRKNNGRVVCIDESLSSTLCGSNVIPVTPPMTTTGEASKEDEQEG